MHRTRSFTFTPIVPLAITLFLSGLAFGATEQVLHTFQGTPARLPSGTLVADAAGNLYGATGNNKVTCAPDCGTVFELERSGGGWSYHVLHVFIGGSDGGEPAYLTLDSQGNIYGNTYDGGTKGYCSDGRVGCGTIYKLTRTAKGGWSETILYRFKGKSDGSSPSNLVFDKSGNLYGAALWGGLASCDPKYSGCGTVFEIDKTGTFSVIYTFQGGSADGDAPSSISIDPSGNLYGSTINGDSCSSWPEGCGVIFELAHGSGGWTETILHAFTGGADGGFPYAAPIFDVSGNAYGTTAGGGSNNCSSGCGAVYELSKSSSWNETVLYSFQGGNDGASPFSAVVFDDIGNLYGSAVSSANGFGVIYELSPNSGSWDETVLHTFTGGSDGYDPNGVIVDTAGDVYGTAYRGGQVKGKSCSGGCGVAYEITH